MIETSDMDRALEDARRRIELAVSKVQPPVTTRNEELSVSYAEFLAAHRRRNPSSYPSH